MVGVSTEGRKEVMYDKKYINDKQEGKERGKVKREVKEIGKQRMGGQ